MVKKMAGNLSENGMFRKEENLKEKKRICKSSIKRPNIVWCNVKMLFGAILQFILTQYPYDTYILAYLWLYIKILLGMKSSLKTFKKLK